MLKFYMAKCSTWNTYYSLLAFVGQFVLSNNFHWDIIIFNLCDRTVKLYQIINILSLSLLIKDFLDLCLQAFTYS